MSEPNTLPERHGIPALGLGTYGRTGPEGVEAILAAIELGYRHLDSAQNYDTEGVIGQVLGQTGVPRDELFVTTKVGTQNLARERFLPSVEESLARLRLPQVDLLLIHWPSPGDAVPFEHYVQDLAEAKARGYARLIGVSNFPIALIERAIGLIGAGQIANNQVEVQPFLQNKRLCDHCAERGISVTAYVPLAKGLVAEDPVLNRIASRHEVPASEIALAWLLARGLIAIPASGQRERMGSNLHAAEIQLSEAEMQEIAGLDRGQRIIAPAVGPAWD